MIFGDTEVVFGAGGVFNAAALAKACLVVAGTVRRAVGILVAGEDRRLRVHVAFPGPQTVGVHADGCGGAGGSAGLESFAGTSSKDKYQKKHKSKSH